MGTHLETCAKCGQPIGKLETPHIWNEQVVCGACRQQLAGGEPQMRYSLRVLAHPMFSVLALIGVFAVVALLFGLSRIVAERATRAEAIRAAESLERLAADVKTGGSFLQYHSHLSDAQLAFDHLADKDPKHDRQYTVDLASALDRFKAASDDWSDAINTHASADYRTKRDTDLAEAFVALDKAKQSLR